MMLRTLIVALMMALPAAAAELRGTGDLGVAVERTTGSLLVLDRSEHAAIGRVEGLGDLSHASVVFSPDERHAFVFGRTSWASPMWTMRGRRAWSWPSRTGCAAFPVASRS